MATKKLNPEDEAKVRALRERLLLTIGFIEGVQDFPSGRELRRIVDDTAGTGNLRALRILAREVDALTISLAPYERDGLEALLLSRLGVDRDAERAALQCRVAAVLQRGTIASEKERRHLEEYADMLEATGGDPAEIAAVRQLVQSG